MIKFEPNVSPKQLKDFVNELKRAEQSSKHRSNELNRDPILRAIDKGYGDAYSYVVLMLSQILPSLNVEPVCWPPLSMKLAERRSRLMARLIIKSRITMRCGPSL